MRYGKSNPEREQIILIQLLQKKKNCKKNFSPFFAGILFDKLGNYTLAFILAGIPPIFGAFFMCLIYKVKSPVSSPPAMTSLETPLDSSGEALVASQTATTVLSAQLEVETESLLKPKGNEN